MAHNDGLQDRTAEQSRKKYFAQYLLARTEELWTGWEDTTDQPQWRLSWLARWDVEGGSVWTISRQSWPDCWWSRPDPALAVAGLACKPIITWVSSSSPNPVNCVHNSGLCLLWSNTANTLHIPPLHQPLYLELEFGKLYFSNGSIVFIWTSGLKTPKLCLYLFAKWNVGFIMGTLPDISQTELYLGMKALSSLRKPWQKYNHSQEMMIFQLGKHQT